MFACVSGGETQVRDASLARIASRVAPEREQIPSATFVPGIALHPSGALVYHDHHTRQRFQAATTAPMDGKKAEIAFKDSSTITLITPNLSQGPQQIVITNSNGESSALDAAFIANSVSPVPISFWLPSSRRLAQRQQLLRFRRCPGATG